MLTIPWCCGGAQPSEVARAELRGRDTFPWEERSQQNRSPVTRLPATAAVLTTCGNADAEHTKNPSDLLVFTARTVLSYSYSALVSPLSQQWLLSGWSGQIINTASLTSSLTGHCPACMGPPSCSTRTSLQLVWRCLDIFMVCN